MALVVGFQGAVVVGSLPWESPRPGGMHYSHLIVVYTTLSSSTPPFYPSLIGIVECCSYPLLGFVASHNRIRRVVIVPGILIF